MFLWLGPHKSEILDSVPGAHSGREKSTPKIVLWPAHACPHCHTHVIYIHTGRINTWLFGHEPPFLNKCSSHPSLKLSEGETFTGNHDRTQYRNGEWKAQPQWTHVCHRSCICSPGSITEEKAGRLEGPEDLEIFCQQSVVAGFLIKLSLTRQHASNGMDMSY